MSAFDDYLLYFSSKLGRKSFVIKKGIGSVMLSAPHSAEQTRNGRKKYGEYHTGAIVNVLHDELNCPIIYKEKNRGDDANYDEKCRYKTKLREYIKKHGIKYLIDIHQMNPSRPEIINIGTGYGKNIKKDPTILEKAIACFSENNFAPVTVDTPFAAIHPYTVSAFISRECGIPCLQIEINTRAVSKRYEECALDGILLSLKRLIQELE